MSPEQAIGAVGKVDQRSDVFGLGGILAAVLTGRPPFAADSAETTRLLAAQGKVEECFARLKNCGADRELVALCRRCLAPDREARPADADEVARAVAALRVAADERARRAELDRVKAEGEKAAAEARLRERHRRRRLLLGASAALVLAALAGLGAVLLVQRQANADLAAKNVRLAEQQAEVEARFELAQKAIATFHTGVSEDALLKNAQLTELRTRLLREAGGFYADLEKLLEGRNDTGSRRLLAAGYAQLGDLTAKIGQKKESLAVQRKALVLRRDLAAAPGADLEAQLDMVRSLLAVGALLEATGDMAGAMQADEEARDLTAALAAESPTDAIRTLLAQSWTAIGTVRLQTSKPAEALAAFQTAREIQQQLVDANPAADAFQSDLARSHGNIGIAFWQTGKTTEGLAAQEKGLGIMQKLADAHRESTLLQQNLAIGYFNIANWYGRIQKQEDALAPYEKAADILQKLTDAHPAVTQYASDLAGTQVNLGLALKILGRPDDAQAAYRRARTILQKLAEADPAVTAFQRDLALDDLNIATLLSEKGLPAEAIRAYQSALDVFQKLADGNPGVPLFRLYVAATCNNMGNLLIQTGQLTEALEAHEKALTLRQKLAAANPTIADFKAALATSHNNIGRVAGRLRQFDRAFLALDEGLAIRQKLADSNPANRQYASQLGYSFAFRGWAHQQVGNHAQAARDLRKALKLWPRSETPDLLARFERSRVLALLAGLAAEARSGVTTAEAGAFADQAVESLHDAIKAGWGQRDELKKPDFDALRGRDDFQKVVKELGEKAAVPPPKK
jgi:tetratricopeptide (TPR) repeat protein